MSAEGGGIVLWRRVSVSGMVMGLVAIGAALVGLLQGESWPEAFAFVVAGAVGFEWNHRHWQRRPRAQTGRSQGGDDA